LISIGHSEQMKITKIEDRLESLMVLEYLDERVECAAHQRRHADEKADRNRHRHGDEIAGHHPRDRIGELDAKAFVVRTAVIERLLQVLPDLQADLGRTGHRRLALARGRADELGVFGIHIGGGPAAHGGEVPHRDE